MSLTDWERSVTKIADQWGLVYERPTGGRNHGKLRDPITDKFRPVSCSPRDEGRAAIHVNNDARRLVALRPKDDPQYVEFEEPSINGHREPVEEELTLEQLDELTTPEPLVPEPPARPKRRIIARSHDERPKKLVLAELHRICGEIDEMETWQSELRQQADRLVARGRKLGLTMPAMAEAAGRSTPWVQTCIRRNSGVGANQSYGKATP